MVVDDSAVVRGLVSKLLDADPRINVVSTAANGEIALRELERRAVDLVVLDVEMPVMDGITALQRIVAEHRATRVVMVSTLTKANAEITLRALHLGASDFVPKPETGLAGAEAFKKELVDKIVALGASRPVGRAQSAPTPAVARIAPVASAAPAFVHRSRAKPQVLAIGASTGGPPALLKVFENLRGVRQLPILLTQHMPATFTALLAEQLSRAADRPCAEGRDGEPVEAGRCYVAPGGWHMTVVREGAMPVIRLNQEAPEHFCRPAVDPMLRSAAAVYGGGVVAAILTGMGSDGAKGCEAVVRAGGRFIAQDEATSAVWGMPAAAAATGLAQAVLPLKEIGPWLRRVMEDAA
jgi:two-component system chemotaxis response regulator CheB